MSDRLLKESDVIREVESLLVSDETRHLNDLEYGNNQALYHVIDRIEDLPSADRPQGEWIFKTVFPNDKSEFPMGHLVCSVCGSHHSNSTPCNYCDNCGARMKGANDE